jgi:hypothetical protein
MQKKNAIRKSPLDEVIFDKFQALLYTKALSSLILMISENEKKEFVSQIDSEARFRCLCLFTDSFSGTFFSFSLLVGLVS